MTAQKCLYGFADLAGQFQTGLGCRYGSKIGRTLPSRAMPLSIPFHRRHTFSYASKSAEIEAAEFSGLKPVAPVGDPGSALTGAELTIWRRLRNLSVHGNEQGYYMGSGHWQPWVDWSDGVLVHEQPSALNGRISVRDHGGFRALRLGDILHSVTYLERTAKEYVASVDTVPFGYVRAMVAAAAAFGAITGVWPGSRSKGSTGNTVVVLGTGGGSLPALLAHHYTQTLVQAIDIDPAVLSVARRFMSLSALAMQNRDNLMLREADALHYVTNLIEQNVSAEVMFLDCYDGKGQVPGALSEPEYLQACLDVLKPGGLLISNLFNDKLGSDARRRFVQYAVNLQSVVGRGNLYSVKVVNQEVNAILVAVKTGTNEGTQQKFTGHGIRRAAKAAGRAVGLRFTAHAELEDLYRVQADSCETFRETRF